MESVWIFTSSYAPLYLFELEKQSITPGLGNGCAVTVEIATLTTPK
jgi:hypothetical protein